MSSSSLSSPPSSSPPSSPPPNLHSSPNLHASPNFHSSVSLCDILPLDVDPRTMSVTKFDILLTDVDEEDLKTEISTFLGSKYLSETSPLSSPLSTIHGILYGQHYHLILPLVVAVRKSPSLVVHFLLDSGSPYTFLSEEACDVLFKHDIPTVPFNAMINGRSVKVNPPNANGHFQHINLLGMDFVAAVEATVTFDLHNKIFKMDFPKNIYA